MVERKVYPATAEKAAVQTPGSGLKEADPLPAEQHSTVLHFVDNAVSDSVEAEDLVAREDAFESAVGELVEPEIA